MGAAYAELLARYFAPFVPRWDGSHLTWLWSRLRDQIRFYPWYRSCTEGRIDWPMTTLLDLGIVERESTRKRYRPTRLVTTLSVGFQEEDTLAEVSRPHIVNLTRDLRWQISVCTRVGMSMMLRESTHAIAPFTLNVYHPGYTLPLLDSSSGKAYVAFSDEAEQEEVIEHVRRIDADNARRLKAALHDIREKGYSIQHRMKHTANPGKTSAISVPIMGEKACEGTVTLAFFCSTMTVTQAIDSFFSKIRATAESIGNDLAARRFNH